MTGLCGWLLHTPLTTMHHDRVLQIMAAGLPPFGAGTGVGAAEPDQAVHAQGRPGTAGVVRADGITAAIEGYPRWDEADLAGRAREHGHAAALLHAYRQFGVDLLSRLKGSFSVAVADSGRRRLLLAIDRLGVSTMCFALAGRGVVFGATTTSVRNHPAVEATISLQTIHDFIAGGICPAPETIFNEQSKLLPAERLVVEDGQVRRDFYWQMPYRTEGPRDVASLGEEMHALLRQAVRRTLEGEDPATVGAYLSGGLDSSTVAGLLAEESGHGARTFTIGFEADDYNEMAYARLASERFKTEQHEHILTADDTLDLMPRLAAAYDEPFANSSAAPAYFCALMARERGASCLLAGDGGDELFGGNKRYVHQKIFETYQHLPRGLRRRLIEPVTFALDRLPVVRKVGRFIRTSNTPMPARMRTDDPFRHILREDTETAALYAAADADHLDVREREAYERTASADLLQRMMHLDLKITLADNDLRKVTRTAMMAGMPVRYPFLDDDVVEFSARVPPDVMIRHFKLRSFYKQAMAGWLPDEIIAKKKHGFGMPYTDWPRRHPRFRELAHACCRSFRNRGYLRPEFVDRIDPTVGDGDIPGPSGLLWDILILELWLQTFSEQTSALRAAS